MQYINAKIRELVRQAIASKIASVQWQHTNGDATFSPSQWGVDSWGDKVHRHWLETSIAKSMNASTGTIDIVLKYNVRGLPANHPDSCPVHTKEYTSYKS